MKPLKPKKQPDPDTAPTPIRVYLPDEDPVAWMIDEDGLVPYVDPRWDEQ